MRVRTSNPGKVQLGSTIGTIVGLSLIVAVPACGDSAVTGTDTDGGGETTGEDETTDTSTETTGGSGINTSTTNPPNTSGTDTASGSDSSTGSSSSTTDESTTDGTTGDTGEDLCGNGVLDEGEECDGSELGGKETCDQLGVGSEAAGNLGCTDECTYDLSTCDICYAPAQNEPCDDNSFDRMHALELNCAVLNFREYDETNSTTINALNFQAPDTDSWRVLSQLGSYIDPETDEPFWSARGGDKFLMLSTGNLGLPQDGVLVEVPGAAQSNTSNDNPDNLLELPGIMKHKHGGFTGDPIDLTPFENCHPDLDCSNTLEEHWKLAPGKGHDVAYFEFEVDVPAGTHGFEIDFAFFSAEYPEWVGENILPYNDLAIIWVASEEYTGNISFIDDGQGGKQPLVTTFLAQRELITLDEAAPELKHTGFDMVGGSTGWLKARARVQPEETIKIAATVVDRGDQLYDTALLLDNFQWTCDACQAGGMEDPSSCGVTFE